MKSPMSYHDLLMFRAENRSSETMENRLIKWARPPGQTEQEKIDRSVRMITDAVKNGTNIEKPENLVVYAKGSYANRTNIPSDSDVDIAVVNTEIMNNEYPPGLVGADFGLVSSDVTYSGLKAEVALDILDKFGKENVTVGEKAIHVHENTVRVDADVVVHLTHRRYRIDGTYDQGVALVKKDGSTIYNWPEQDYANGVIKNTETGKQYKSVVRIVKNLRCAMIAEGVPYAGEAASYLIACLIYNVPDYYFVEDTYEKMVSDILLYLKLQLSDLKNVASWNEVNNMKKLFGDHQAWDFDKVSHFTNNAYQFFEELRK